MVYLWLVETGVMEVLILAKIHLVEYVSKEMKDVNLRVFNIIKEKNESKSLIKHILCECRFGFDGSKFSLK